MVKRRLATLMARDSRQLALVAQARVFHLASFNNAARDEPHITAGHGSIVASPSPRPSPLLGERERDERRLGFERRLPRWVIPSHLIRTSAACQGAGSHDTCSIRCKLRGQKRCTT